MKWGRSIKIDFSGLDMDVDIQAMKMELAEELAMIGEAYIKEARTKELNALDFKKHKNWTHNLLNAHSYVVYVDGKSVFNNIGSSATLAGFDNAKTGKDVELIVGNGMEYASYVEGKGFDVVSSGFFVVMKEIRKDYENAKDI